jgi:hypothetical protein
MILPVTSTIRMKAEGTPNLTRPALHWLPSPLCGTFSSTSHSVSHAVFPMARSDGFALRAFHEQERAILGRGLKQEVFVHSP